MKNYPLLRFPGYTDNWKVRKIKELTDRVAKSVKVEINDEYQEIGIRSHCKGIFHKSSIRGRELGNKRVFWVENDCFVVNIVFAWEHAIAKTSLNETGMIASHRFPMYKPKKSLLTTDFLLDFFSRPRGKYLLGLASPGGAGRNKTLGQKAFGDLEITIPDLSEQNKIVNLLNNIDSYINNLELQKNEIRNYKKYILQNLLSQKIRFKDKDDKPFPNWDKKYLKDIFYPVKGRGLSKGVIVSDGRSECILYGELYTSYKEVVEKVKSRTNINNGVKSKVGDLLIPCSTTTSGIDLANVTALNKEGVLLGGDITILRTSTKINNVFFAYYLANYKKSEFVKYAQGSTIIHLYYNHFKKMLIDIPSFVEQEKIANFLIVIDKILDSKQNQIYQAKKWKNGLIQKLFV